MGTATSTDRSPWAQPESRCLAALLGSGGKQAVMGEAEQPGCPAVTLVCAGHGGV